MQKTQGTLNKTPVQLTLDKQLYWETDQAKAMDKSLLKALRGVYFVAQKTPEKMVPMRNRLERAVDILGEMRYRLFLKHNKKDGKNMDDFI
jgi:hypothetical protein